MTAADRSPDFGRTEFPWSPADDALLLSLVGRVRWIEAAGRLDRRRGSCMTRAGQLLLGELLGNRADEIDLVAFDRADRDRAAWTRAEERALMAAIVGGDGWHQVAARFGRQPSSCRTRAEVIALNQYVGDLIRQGRSDARDRADRWRQADLTKPIRPPTTITDLDGRRRYVAGALARIGANLAARFPDVGHCFRPPTDHAAIERAEARLGGRLPASVRAAYLHHDGAIDGAGIFPIPPCWQWLSLDAAVEATMARRQAPDAHPGHERVDWSSVFVLLDGGPTDAVYTHLVDDPAKDTAVRVVTSTAAKPVDLQPSFAALLRTVNARILVDDDLTVARLEGPEPGDRFILVPRTHRPV